MRVLKIRFENLNALAGEWEIDLRADVYRTDGIFLISGPTGAGKTTILDAVCLALYGETPRLGRITKSANEAMSRHTGECFAEVLFETRKGRFQCTFSQHRAGRSPKGALQTPRHEIVEADTGRVIETKLKQVLIAVEQVTGMNFERFTRSMLLAQGEFAAFLNAGEDDRSSILEQLTGAEIYSRISVAVFERWRDEGRALQILGQSMKDEPLLDDAVREALNAEHTECITREAVVSTEIATLGHLLQHRRRAEELTRELEALAERLTRCEAQWAAFAPEQKRLAHAARAAETEGRHAVVKTLRDAQSADGEALRARQEQVPELKAAEEHATKRLNEAEAALSGARAQAEREHARINQARLFDAAIADKQAQIDAVSASATRISSEVRQMERALVHLEQTRDTVRARLEGIGQYQHDRRIDASLIENLTGIEKRFEMLRDADQRYRAAETALGEARGDGDALRAELATLEATVAEQRETFATQNQAIERLAQKRDALSKTDVATLQAELGAFDERIREYDRLAGLMDAAQEVTREMESLGERRTMLDSRRAVLEKEMDARNDRLSVLEKEIALLAENAALSRRVHDLEAERQRLEDGKPCPLCGATEHPFADGNLPVQPEIEQALAAAGQRRTELTSALADHRTEIAEIRARLEQLGERTRGLEQRREALREERDGVASKLGVDNATAPYAVALARETMDRDRVRLKETLGKASALDRKILEKQSDRDTCREALVSRENARERLATRILETEKQIARLCAEAEALARNRDALVERTAEAVAPYGIETVSIETLAESLEALTARCREWRMREQERETLQQQQAAATGDMALKQGILEKQRTRLAEVGSEQTRLASLVHADRAARVECLGDRHPDTEARRIAEMLAAAEAALDAARLAADGARERRNRAEEAMALIDAGMKTRQQTLDEETAHFTAALLRLGFADEAAFLEARLSRTELEQLRDTEAGLRAEKDDLAHRIADRQEALAAALEGALDAEPKETLERLLEERHSTLKAVHQRIGSLEQQLKDDDDARERQATRQARYAEKARRFETFDKLHTLIGAHDGKRFRNFAQGLTLETVIQHANLELFKMSDRYQLVRDTTEPLALNVVDHYQAGEIRSTQNLSGGESFIVSLALALGLSRMASDKVQVDALFLDEGFGTLDDETLDTALDTLAFLREEGKLIGLISHVAPLKERIAAQIEVVPMAGGRSRIVGPGCRRIEG